MVAPLAAEATRASRVRYRVLAAACGLAFVTYVQRLGFGMGLPEIKRDLGLSDEQMGYLASAFLVAYGGFQVPGGFLGDRLGGRNVLACFVLGWSLLTGAVALTVFLPADVLWRFSVLLVLRVLYGLFQGGGFPVLSRVVAEWTPVARRASALGTVWMFSRLGGACVPFLFLGLMRAFRTWTVPFWIMAGLGLAWCVAVWPWLRNRPEEMAEVNAEERALIASGRGAAADSAGPFPWRRALGSVNIWALCLMYGGVGFAGNFFTNLLVLYLRDHRHLNEDEGAWVAGLVLACGLVACLVGGLLSDLFIRLSGSRRWGRRLSGGLGLAFAGLTMLASLWVRDVWLLGFLFGVAFFCNDLNMAPAWAACADVGGRYTGTISGAMNMVGNLGGAAGMALTGVLLSRQQADLLFIIYACSYALGALCWLAVDATKPLARATEPGS
jgi:sugar phosphate permease